MSQLRTHISNPPGSLSIVSLEHHFHVDAAYKSEPKLESKEFKTYVSVNDVNVATETAETMSMTSAAPSDNAASVLSRKRRRWYTFGRILYIFVMNCAVPIMLYYILKPHIPPVWALVLSSTPTMVSVVAQAIFMRRIDSIGIAVIFGFFLSVILAAVNGDPKLLLMRESFVTAGVGVLCALTLVPIRINSFELKPILYYLARDLIPLQPVQYPDQRPPETRLLFYWRHSPGFKLHVRLLTALDIAILELEFALKLFYILTFDLDLIVILSNSTISVIIIILTSLNIWYAFRIRNRLRKEESALLHTAGALPE